MKTLQQVSIHRRLNPRSREITRGILLLLIVFSASAIYGGQPALGVAGVDVVVKQSPTKRAVTDARGNFILDALPAGSYTLAFRAQKAKDTRTPSNKVTVAGSYSIKSEGTRRPVNQSGLTSNKLLGGVDIPVEVVSGAKIRGQVLAGAIKKMVWIGPALGSNIPGHWVEEGSKEASALNKVQISRDDMRDMRAPDPHQEGFGR
jgi:hypothetical protein